MKATAFIKERYLWLRCLFPVVFSHKPLCDRFRADVLRIGPVHLCRSCVCLYSGLFWALAVVLSLRVDLEGLNIALAGILLTVIVASFPVWYIRFHRRVRDVLRFLLGCMLAVPVGLAVNGEWRSAGLFAGALLVMRVGYAPFHRGLNHAACQGCAELEGLTICSGFVKKAQCMKRYEEGLTSMLGRDGR